MSASARHSRGFATIVAIGMLGLVSTTLLILTRQFSFEVQRTRLTSQDAQLRQLLLAGAEDAAEHSKQWGDAPHSQTWQLALPRMLADAKGSVSLSSTVSNDHAVDVEVKARLDQSRSIQTLHFLRTGGRWIVGGAVLGK